MAFDNINNYYEKLVFEKIQDKLFSDQLDNDEDYLADIACVALNQLPSRYVR
ncbi:MAG: late competence development ComFB family protein, partial [Gammaproteobacteria bacterium]|nr:late competence development ComFB family protein [Gammaproteobacteria bacterium]